jgi:signal transduction histidine kinase
MGGIASEVLGILADVLCLALNRVGQTTLAGLGFVYLSLGLLLYSAAQTSSGLDIQTLFIFTLVTLYLYIAGLVLPGWAIWPTLVLTTAATVATAILTPVAPGLTPAAAQNLRGLLISFPAIYILTALLAWIAARSSQSSIVAAAQAFTRERELDALKDQFIIDANHELRTPLMALYGSVELLATYGDRASPEQQDRLVQRALTSGDRVLRLLSNVLDAGVIEAQAPRLSLKPFELAPVVISVLETFDPREIGEPRLEPRAHADRAVTVDIPPVLGVVADEDRVRQVLINLLSNALKYSEPDTPLTIAAKVLPPVQTNHGVFGRRRAHATAGMVQVSVRDHGLGIPPREVSKLFNRFVRLERDITGPVRGTGVGLYVCRVLVEAMGGSIWVESTGIRGEGSTFSFTLPPTPV